MDIIKNSSLAGKQVFIGNNLCVNRIDSSSEVSSVELSGFGPVIETNVVVGISVGNEVFTGKEASSCHIWSPLGPPSKLPATFVVKRCSSDQRD